MQMKCYAVIDTNVLVSALLSSHDNAATVKVIDKILYGDVIPVFSDEIIKEYREVLLRKKFKFPLQLVDTIIAEFERIGEHLNPDSINETLLDMKDLPFYEVVIEKRKHNESYLVTGNIKHFPKNHFIVTPAEFIEIIEDL